MALLHKKSPGASQQPGQSFPRGPWEFRNRLRGCPQATLRNCQNRHPQKQPLGAWTTRGRPAPHDRPESPAEGRKSRPLTAIRHARRRLSGVALLALQRRLRAPHGRPARADSPKRQPPIGRAQDRPWRPVPIRQRGCARWYRRTGCGRLATTRQPMPTLIHLSFGQCGHGHSPVESGLFTSTCDAMPFSIFAS